VCFTFYDFFTLLTTFTREYIRVLTSFHIPKLLWRCITVALFLKIKKACNRLYNQFTGLLQVGRGGISLYSYGFQRLLSTFTMPIFDGVWGLSLLWTFLHFCGVALRLH